MQQESCLQYFILSTPRLYQTEILERRTLLDLWVMLGNLRKDRSYVNYVGLHNSSLSYFLDSQVSII